MATPEQTQQFAPLGHTRLRIVSCLGGDMPSLPQYLTLAPGQTAFEAFRGFVAHMTQICSTDRDPSTRALIGAARLLVGDLAGANEILEHLPATAVALDQGAGYCRVLPAHALQAALPLPESLRQAPHVLSGSREQAELRAWLERHESSLAWDEPRGAYGIVDAHTSSGQQP
jgi:hypothetical protein